MHVAMDDKLLMKAGIGFNDREKDRLQLALVDRVAAANELGSGEGVNALAPLHRDEGAAGMSPCA